MSEFLDSVGESFEDGLTTENILSKQNRNDNKNKHDFRLFLEES